jgi:hypothetical protein
MAGESPMNDLFEMIQKLWNPMNLPLPAVLTPSLNPAEIEKKIKDLRTVEAWLTMNLNMLQTTIKALEMQKSGIEALSASAGAVRTTAEAFRNSAEAIRKSAETPRDDDPPPRS